jgi:hypothetical protein
VYRAAQSAVKRGLADRIDLKSQTAVREGKWIPIANYLIPPAALGTQQLEDETTETITRASDGSELQLKRSSKPKMVVDSLLSFHTAIRNWSRTVAVLLPEQQDDADGLVDYTMDMCNTLKGIWRPALEYFEHIRQSRTGLIHQPWSQVDVVQYAQCMVTNSTFSSLSSSSSSSDSTNSSATARSTNSSRRFCFAWQKGECDRGTSCSFLHRCDACDVSGHNGKSCPRGPSPASVRRSGSAGAGKGKSGAGSSTKSG